MDSIMFIPVYYHFCHNITSISKYIKRYNIKIKNELDFYTVKKKHYRQLHLLQLIMHNRTHFLQKYLCYPHNFDLIKKSPKTEI